MLKDRRAVRVTEFRSARSDLTYDMPSRVHGGIDRVCVRLYRIRATLRGSNWQGECTVPGHSWVETFGLTECRDDIRAVVTGLNASLNFFKLTARQR